jgi:nucleotide-binding universal stress UspA family protein
MRRILVGVDGSATARAALEVALGLAARLDALAVVVHILPPSEWTPTAFSMRAVPERLEPEGDAVLRAAANRAEALNARYKLELVGDVPAEALARLADIVEADLIVVGLGRKRGLSRAVHPNIARALSNSTTRPVLIVPPAAGVHENGRAASRDLQTRAPS